MAAGEDSISGYRIVGTLGVGGMGIVHRAHDPELGRDVALKVLSPELREDDHARRRFLREARAAAKLSHPNIATIHEVGSDAGTAYLAMEVVEGRTLADVLEERALEMGEALSLAVEIAEALEYAHERGVVHRDLKAANVMLDVRGRAVLLDFGLAKVLDDQRAEEQDTNSVLTIEGTLVGTPKAMSPEQAAGAQVDRRSDVFSFGALVYELLTRKGPFERGSALDTLCAVLHAEADDILELRPDLPRPLVRIVERAMRKEPDERFQTMGEMADALRAVRDGRTGPSPLLVRMAVVVPLAALLAFALIAGFGGEGADDGGRRSIAVVPFITTSSDAEDRAFAAGVHADVLAQIAKIADLKVIAGSSVAAAVEETRDPERLGRRLDVASLLEGQVQRAGDRVRIQFALVDTATAEQLWVETFDRSFSIEDLFEIQSEVAAEVVLQLDAEMTVDERLSIDTPPTDDLQAYEAYLRAQAETAGFGSGSLKTGQEWLERAFEIDPDFVLARAGYAQLVFFDTWMNAMDLERRAEARRVLARATEIDPTHPEVRKVNALLAYQDRDYDRARRMLDELAGTHPNDVGVLSIQGGLLRRDGELEASLVPFERSIQVAPLDTPSFNSLATTLLALRRYDEADDAFASALGLTPDFGPARIGRLEVELALCETPDAARAAMRAFVDAMDGFAPGSFLWSEVLDLQLSVGDLEAARRTLADAPEWTLTQVSLELAAQYRGELLLLDGEAEAARAAFDEALGLAGAREDADDARVRMARALALAGLGRRDEALGLVDLARAEFPRNRDVFVWERLTTDAALVMALLDEPERGAELLLELVTQPGRTTVRAVTSDPRLATLASDPRWIAGVEALRR